MIHVIRKILVDTSAVTTLVPAASIHLVMARQGTERPYIAIDLEETQFERTNVGISGEVYNVLVYITDTKISGAWAIHTAVKNALSEYTGTVTVDSVDYVIDQLSLVDVMTDSHELHDFDVVAMSFNLYMC